MSKQANQECVFFGDGLACNWLRGINGTQCPSAVSGIMTSRRPREDVGVGGVAGVGGRGGIRHHSTKQAARPIRRSDYTTREHNRSALPANQMLL